MTVLKQMRSRVLLSLLALGLAGAGAFETSAGRGLPAQQGINNFGKVDGRFYRGAQPDRAGLERLARLGVKTIINLRMPHESWPEEAEAARALGICYTNIPMHGFGRPTDLQVRTVLGLMETLPGPVFIHCLRGCDRTGTVIACYRIRHDRWRNRSALREAVHYGLSRFEWGMRKYITAFDKQGGGASGSPVQEASAKSPH